MKSVFKRTVSAFLSLLFVFGLVFFESAGIVADAATEVNHYEYSYGYLQWYLVNYGELFQDGYVIQGANFNTETFTHTYNIWYDTIADHIYFSYSCTDLSANEPFMWVKMDLYPEESTAYTITCYRPKAGLWAMSRVNPRNYRYEDSLLFTFVDEDGKILAESVTDDTFSQAFAYGTDYWNDILIDNLNITLGNFKFTNLYLENTGIYPKIYTVTFNSNGHGAAPARQNVIEGDKVSNPGNLTASGYTFMGWYKESGCINAWDFNNDTVTKNMVLYAKWEKNSSAGDDTPDHTHTFGSKWKSDKNNHWKECECGQKSNIEAHKFNSGTVTKSATATETGIKTFTCTVCGYKKTETIPISGTDKVAKVKISAPSGTKTINWKYRARLVATATGLPAGYHIAWYEGGTKVSDSADFTTASLTSAHTLTARIVDEMGNAVSTPAQEKTVTIEVKDDFFTKIISFFSRLFGSDVVKV